MNFNQQRRVLFITVPGDAHAHAISWGLKQNGWETDFLFFSDFPQLNTISILNNRCIIYASGRQINLDDFDTIWVRKVSDAVLPGNTHKSDRLIAKRFWEYAISGMLQCLKHSHKFVINGKDGVDLSAEKILQLQVAGNCGLLTPRTLVSTTKTDIIAFIENNFSRQNNTIVKGLYLAMWDFGSDGLGVFETERVTVSEIQAGGISLAPNIFQEEINKAYEVRLTVMGDSFFGAKLDSQMLPETSTDYRKTRSFYNLGCGAIAVPENIKDAVRLFQKRLGVNFGAYDFIVDHQDRWIFLEINPMGQFLWIEDVNSEIPILDAAVSFVSSMEEQFQYDFTKDNKARLSEWKKSDDFVSFNAGFGERERHVKLDVPVPNDLPIRTA